MIDNGIAEQLKQRVIELEISLSHQQETVAQLNVVVTEQAMRMQTLERSFSQLKTQQQSLRDLVAEQGSEISHEKPPHY